MTTRTQHDEQARDNLDLYEHLAAINRHLDWALTALFYSAVHYIDAFLLPENPRSHRRRNEIISRRPELNAVYRNYRLLLDRSRETRYECFDPTPHQLRSYREHLFDPIQAHMLGLRRSQDNP